jgi:hypothetical protein
MKAGTRDIARHAINPRPDAGVGRVASIIQVGLPAPELVGARAFVIGTTAIEIVGMPLLWWWHVAVRKE